MAFQTDSHFLIGRAHINAGSPCQDYCLAEVHGNVALAVVSDGCSSGSRTDIGARVIALSTIRAIDLASDFVAEGYDKLTFDVSARQQEVLSGTQNLLGLTLQDLLASCVYIYATPDGGFVHLQGDGVVAYKQRNGHLTMICYEWEGNLPYYPAYAERGLENFIHNHGGDTNAVRLTAERWEFTPDSGFQEFPVEGITLGEGIRGITIPLPPIADLEFAAVFTDGVNQVENMDWKEAVRQLLGFKTTAGEFVKRRMSRFVKDAEKLGRGPMDDISAAVIRVTHPEMEV